MAKWNNEELGKFIEHQFQIEIIAYKKQNQPILILRITLLISLALERKYFLSGRCWKYSHHWRN